MVVTKRALPAILAATVLLALIAPSADAVFAGKPGRIAYSAELPGEDQTGPDPSIPPGAPRTLIDRGFDVFTVHPDGSDTRRLTGNGTEPDDEHDPNWSPDGTLLAFSAVHPFVPNQFGPYPIRPESRLEVMAPDGSGRRVVLPYSAAGGPRSPLFFPNGDRLYYAWSHVDIPRGGVQSVALDGSGIRDEDPNLSAYYGPHISPDGRVMVFESGGDLHVGRLDGSRSRNITNTPGVYDSDPAFAPDMSAVVYRSQVPGDTTPPFAHVITVVDLESGQQRVISSPLNVAAEPDWGAIPVNCAGRRATIVGTEGKDKLVGTKGRDVIAGLGGKDTIKGKGGKDVLCGGKGRDKLLGGKGKDLLHGGKGKDRCIGGKGRDRAKGCEREKKI